MDNALAILATVSLAHLLAVASPGPDFAMVARRSLALGREAGLWTAAGIGTGILFHVGYGLFGLSWLSDRFPGLLDLLGIAGGVFLVWMGFGALRAQPQTAGEAAVEPPPRGDHWRDFSIGLLTNVLNPKATLFFVALFTVAVTGPIGWPLKLALGLWLPLSTFAWFALVATVLSRPAARARLLRAAHWIDRAMGLVLVALGASLLFGRLP